MRSVLLSALIVGLTSPVAAADLVYKRRPAEFDVLARYDGQPYWRVLATCAGMHGAMANAYNQQGRAADGSQAKRHGLAFAQSALRRLQADRGLERAPALDLVTPAVNEGRMIGSTLLQRRSGRFTPEQVVDATCTQASERHEQASNGR